MHNHYNMRGCSRKHRRHPHGGSNSLSLGYTGVAPKEITNPFLGYTGATTMQKGGVCNASAPSNAANFLGYNGRQNGGGVGAIAVAGVPSGAPIGGVTGQMLSNAEVVSDAPNLLAQKGGMAPRLINADSFSNAPNLLAQNGGDGFPKPMPDATINLSDSGSVFTGSDPYLVTGGSHQHRRYNGGATGAIAVAGVPTGAPVGGVTAQMLGNAEMLGNAADLPTQRGGMAPDIAKAYPSTVGTPAHMNWINNQTLHGGRSHRNRRRRSYRGGDCGCSAPLFGGQKGGRNYGDLVPNGLLGQSWTSNIGTWPGVDGVAMNRGHYDLNTYANDVSRQTQAIGANFPFSGLPWKGGSSRRPRRRRSTRRRRRHTRRAMSYKQGCNRKMRGGALSNFLSQDIINLGREFGFNVNSAYNALNGAPAPVNPLPWKGQLETSVSK